MMGTGTKKLNEILNIRNHLNDPTEVGYGKTYSKETLQSNFVPAQKGFDIEMMLPHPAPHQRHMHKKKFTTIKCHYCGKNGHRKSSCYKLYGHPKKKPQSQTRAYHARAKVKKEWKPRVKEAAHIAHTSLGPSSREDWYFDSDCSRHMTCVEKYLKDIKSYTTSYLTFGDGAKGKIKGIGKLHYSGKNGHRKSSCYKLYGYPKKKPQSKTRAYHKKGQGQERMEAKSQISCSHSSYIPHSLIKRRLVL
jgi:hypothetical protein